MNKIGIVLEGGAMRGMFTAGILDVLMPADSEGRVFDLFGRKVLDSESDLQSLPKGVYVRDGKKLIK